MKIEVAFNPKTFRRSCGIPSYLWSVPFMQSLHVTVVNPVPQGSVSSCGIFFFLQIIERF